MAIRRLTPDEQQRVTPVGAAPTGGGGGIPQSTGASLLSQFLPGGISTGEKRTIDTLQSLGIIPPQPVPESVGERKEASKQSRKIQNLAPQILSIVSSAEKAPAGFAGAAASLLGKIPGVGGGEAEFLRRDAEGMAKAIADAFAIGESRPTDVDIKRWLGLVPRPGDTREERQRQSIKLLRAIETNAQSLGIEPPPEITDAIQKLSGREATTAGGGSKFPTGAALGGLTGGTIGSLLGPAGTIGGTAAGTAAGGAIENLIKDVRGTQTQRPEEQVAQVGGETALATLLSLPAAALQKIFGSIKTIKSIPKIGEEIGEQFVAGRKIDPKSTKQMIKMVDEQARSTISRNPAVKAAWEIEKNNIKSITNSGELLEDLVQRVNKLAKFGGGNTNEQNLVANLYKTISAAYKDQLPSKMVDLLNKSSSAQRLSSSIGRTTSTMGGQATRTGVGFGLAGIIKKLLGK